MHYAVSEQSGITMDASAPKILIVGPESERRTQAANALVAAECAVDQIARAEELAGSAAVEFDAVLADLNAIDLESLAAALSNVKTVQIAAGAADKPLPWTPESLRKVAHELRTPLNAILGWAQLLKYGDLDDDMRQEALDTIERSAKAQADMISKMLDLPST